MIKIPHFLRRRLTAAARRKFAAAWLAFLADPTRGNQDKVRDAFQFIAPTGRAGEDAMLRFVTKIARIRIRREEL